MITLPDFRSLNVAVIGDMMLDEYYDCSIDRISPEAPVLIAKTDCSRKKVSLGGAGNTAKNCVGLKARTTLYSVVGDDGFGVTLHQLCNDHDINTFLFSEENINTIRKVRYRQNYHQLIRIDYEDKKYPYKVDNHIYRELIETFKENIIDYDLVILSDYKKGTLSEMVCREVISNCNSMGIPVFVDPKGTSWGKYESATCLTPNFNEFRAMTNNNLRPTDNIGINLAAKDLLSDFSLEYMLITKGEHGINLVSNVHNKFFSNVIDAEEVYDVSGAGDTVISIFALSMLMKIDFEEAVQLSNIAAKTVIKRSGTQAIDIKDLQREIGTLQVN